MTESGSETEKQDYVVTLEDKNSCHEVLKSKSKLCCNEFKLKCFKTKMPNINENRKRNCYNVYCVRFEIAAKDDIKTNTSSVILWIKSLKEANRTPSLDDPTSDHPLHSGIHDHIALKICEAFQEVEWNDLCMI